MAGEHAPAIKYYIMKTHPKVAHGGGSFGDGPEGRNDDPGTAVGLGGRFCDQGCAGSAQSQCRGDDLGASALVDGGFNDEDWRFLATAPPELLRPGGVSPWAGARSVKCLPGGRLRKGVVRGPGFLGGHFFGIGYCLFPKSPSVEPLSRNAGGT